MARGTVSFEGVEGSVGEDFFQVLRRDVNESTFFFPVLDSAFGAAAHEGEIAAHGLDDEGIEAVETDEMSFRCLAGFVYFASDEDGVDFRAGKKDDPIADDNGIEDGNEINVAAIHRRVPLPPDANGVKIFCHLDVAGAAREKFIEMLEGDDEFSFAGFGSEVFDGVADGKHGAVIEDVRGIGCGDVDGDGGRKFFAMKLETVELAVYGIEVDLEFFVETFCGLDFLSGFNKHRLYYSHGMGKMQVEDGRFLRVSRKDRQERKGIKKYFIFV